MLDQNVQFVPRVIYSNIIKSKNVNVEDVAYID